MLTTWEVIWFSVRVTDLKEHITEVETSDKTDNRRRTSTFWPASRLALIARERVRVGSRPAGTSATITPTANRRLLRGSIPTSSDAPRKTMPTVTAEPAMTMTARFSSSCSGVARRRTAVVRRDIWPRRVPAPVARTTATPEPVETKVPAKTRLLAPSGARSGAFASSAPRPTGREQPGLRRDLRFDRLRRRRRPCHRCRHSPRPDIAPDHRGTTSRDATAGGAEPGGHGHSRFRGDGGHRFPRCITAGRNGAAQQPPVRGRGDRRAGARGPAAHPDPLPGDERQAAGGPEGAGPPSVVCLVAGLNLCYMLLQVGYSYREPDDLPGCQHQRLP